VGAIPTGGGVPVGAVSDDCDAGLNISAGGSVLGFLGNGAGVPSNESGSCQTFGESFAPDGSFIVEPTRRQLELSAYSDAFEPDLYVRLTCDSRSELLCEAGSGSETTIDQNLPLEGLPADLNVFVDGGSVGNAYTLDYEP